MKIMEGIKKMFSRSNCRSQQEDHQKEPQKSNESWTWREIGDVAFWILAPFVDVLFGYILGWLSYSWYL